MITVRLQYGAEGELSWTAAPSTRLIIESGPGQTLDVEVSARNSLAQPLEMPPLSAAIVPGDRVVVALERETRLLAAMLPVLWSTLEQAGVSPSDLTFLQPAALDAAIRQDPRRLLPTAVRELARWKIHDPTDEQSCGYLASSAAGERIYLARELLDADFVLPVSVAGFDVMQGYRHPAGVLYPGLSNLEAFRKTHGQGHQELRPEDDRPLRQLIDEAGWLLGVQYALQVVPSARRGAVAEIVVGSVEAVGRRTRSLLDQSWRVRRSERSGTVIAVVPTIEQPASWNQLGSAIAAARSLVERKGRLIVVSDLAAAPGPGIELIRQQRSAKSALQPLRAASPEDLLPATQLASAADWCQIYLLSRLDPTLVEELFCTPLANETELLRLLATVDDAIVLMAAQHAYCEVD